MVVLLRQHLEVPVAPAQRHQHPESRSPSRRRRIIASENAPTSAPATAFSLARRQLPQTPRPRPLNVTTRTAAPPRLAAAPASRRPARRRARPRHEIAASSSRGGCVLVTRSQRPRHGPHDPPSATGRPLRRLGQPAASWAGAPCHQEEGARVRQHQRPGGPHDEKHQRRPGPAPRAGE